MSELEFLIECKIQNAKLLWRSIDPATHHPLRLGPRSKESYIFTYDEHTCFRMRYSDFLLFKRSAKPTDKMTDSKTISIPLENLGSTEAIRFPSTKQLRAFKASLLDNLDKVPKKEMGKEEKARLQKLFSRSAEKEWFSIAFPLRWRSKTTRLKISLDCAEINFHLESIPDKNKALVAAGAFRRFFRVQIRKEASILQFMFFKCNPEYREHVDEMLLKQVKRF